MNSKSLVAMILIIFTLACGKKEGKSVEISFIYEVDTVLIDSKSNILYLERGLGISDYNPNEGILYNFNRFDHSIEKIDLNSLELVEKVFFEKEGPNGIPSYVGNIKIVNSESVFLADNSKSGLFGLDEGDLINKFDWKDAVSDKETHWGQTLIPTFDHLLFSLVKKRPDETISLKLLNTKFGLTSDFDVDPNNNYKSFTLKISDPANFTMLDPLIFVFAENEKVFVTHEFSNEIHVYHPDADSLQSIFYQSAITPSKVVTQEKDQNLSHFNELQQSYQAYLEQAKFGVLVWDELNKRYYRLSSYMQFADTRKEGALLSDILKSNVVLSIFDEDLQLIREMLVPELVSERVKFFVKDGSLWVFKNIDDELGFVRISLKEKAN